MRTLVGALEAWTLGAGTGGTGPRDAGTGVTGPGEAGTGGTGPGEAGTGECCRGAGTEIKV